jgi:hypothetical protein
VNRRAVFTARDITVSHIYSPSINPWLLSRKENVDRIRIHAFELCFARQTPNNTKSFCPENFDRSFSENKKPREDD